MIFVIKTIINIIYIMVKYIYYTGVGAKENGKHSVKEFLDIMNKNFNVECSEFLPEMNYKPCSEYKEMNRKAIAYNIKHNRPLLDYNRSKKNEKKYQKLLNSCKKYKKTAKNKKCNLDEYVEFSGAEKH
jgi:S-ribosylhomocysteine lyase LuxS involved in autoinducer biosynthesis